MTAETEGAEPRPRLSGAERNAVELVRILLMEEAKITPADLGMVAFIPPGWKQPYWMVVR